MMKRFHFSSAFRLMLAAVFLFSQSGMGLAAELEDRWSRVQEEEINAKQAKINDLKGKIEVLSKQVEDERKTTAASQEKIWKEYKHGVEAERKALQDQLNALEERGSLFEKELDKKREQDQIQIREKQDQIQSLISQVDFLNKQIIEDRKTYEEQSRALKDAAQKQTAASGGSAPQTGENVSNNSIRLSGGSAYTDQGYRSQSFKTARPEYYIEIGDALAIDVWRVPDLTREVTVRPDGRISMPIVGDIDVVGMTLVEFRDVLTKKFTEYVWNPQVSISVRQFGGRKFVILGEVRGPGVYRFQQDISLIEGIALAGGFAPNAKRGRVMVIRGDIRRDPQVKIITANMENVLRKGMLSENLTLMPNDIVYVTKDFLGDYRDVIDNIITPTFGAGTDFFVLRSAIRTAQDRRN